MASSSVETVRSGAETIKWVASAALLVAGLVAFFTLSSQGAWVQWGALIAACALSVVVYLMSESGRRLIAFAKDSWREALKVVWPTRKETTQMTMYVFGFTVVMSIALWLIDKGLTWVIYDLILGWK